MLSPLKFLWETTGTMETKTSLKLRYRGIPASCISNAIDAGVRNLEDLRSAWYKHDELCTKTKHEAQRRSVKHMKGWTLRGLEHVHKK